MGRLLGHKNINSKKIEKVCHCGKSFLIRPSLKNLIKSCSFACKINGRPKGSKNRVYRLVSCICLNCQKPFDEYPSRIKQGRGKYCSRSCYAASLIGKPSNKKGKKHTEESKQKMSKAQKKTYLLGRKQNIEALRRAKVGRKQTMEHRLKNSGANHHDWKGGISPINERIRGTVEYEEWRQAVFKRDNYTCQHCGQRGLFLNADHIKPFSLYPALRFNVSNGRTLCRECHQKTDTWGKRVYKQKLNGKNYQVKMAVS